MDPLLRSLLISLGLMLAGAGVGWAITKYWRIKDRNRLAFDRRALAAVATMDRVLELETQLAQLKLTVTPITAAMQQLLIDKLTHFHTPELDALMVEAQKGTISTAGQIRMAALLADREKEVDAEVDEYERICARILPDVTRLVLLGKDEDPDPIHHELKVVSVPLKREQR